MKTYKKIFRGFIHAMLLPLNIIVHKFPKNNIILQEIVRNDIVANSRVKWKFFKINLDEKDIPKYNLRKTGIVMQGPIRYEEDFTLKTAMLYRQIYPDIPIVITTGDKDISNKFIEQCKVNKIEVLKNKLPCISGYGHVNYQVCNTIKGINYLEGRARYILKTRTDQAFYYPAFLIFLQNILYTFKKSDSKMSGRLVFLGARNSYRWIPFHVSDFMAFGRFDDMKKLYDIPYSVEPKKLVNHAVLDRVRNEISYYELTGINCNNNSLRNKLRKVLSHYINAEAYRTNRTRKNI